MLCFIQILYYSIPIRPNENSSFLLIVYLQPLPDRYNQQFDLQKENKFLPLQWKPGVHFNQQNEFFRSLQDGHPISKKDKNRALISQKSKAQLVYTSCVHGDNGFNLVIILEGQKLTLKNLWYSLVIIKLVVSSNSQTR